MSRIRTPIEFAPPLHENDINFLGTTITETGKTADKAIEEPMSWFSSKSESASGAQLAVHTERRAHQRFEWKGTAAVRILPNGPDVLGVLVDISERGCGIEIGIVLPAAVGDKVHLDLHINGLSLTPAGIIRNIRQIRSVEKETHVGIEFTKEFERFAGLLTQR